MKIKNHRKVKWEIRGINVAEILKLFEFIILCNLMLDVCGSKHIWHIYSRGKTFVFFLWHWHFRANAGSIKRLIRFSLTWTGVRAKRSKKEKQCCLNRKSIHKPPPQKKMIEIRMFWTCTKATNWPTYLIFRFVHRPM